MSVAIFCRFARSCSSSAFAFSKALRVSGHTWPRNWKGRAYIKLGEEDITPIQTALVPGVSGASGSQALPNHRWKAGLKPPVSSIALRM